MPPILYTAKRFSFSDQVGYSKNVVDKLESLLLQLWHDLNDYKKHDTRVLFLVQLLKHLIGTAGVRFSRCSQTNFQIVDSKILLCDSIKHLCQVQRRSDTVYTA